MRLLSLNIKEDIIDYLQENNFYICDDTIDMEDAIYHAEVRHYNIILINHNNTTQIKELLKKVNPRKTAVICLCDALTKKDEIKLLKKGALCVLDSNTDEDILLAKMYAIHKENFQMEYKFNEKYTINKEENSISDEQNNKLVINGKPFSILEYLIKNRHHAAISKEELLDVLWDDPEWVVRNVVEVNINIIRKGIQNTFQDNFINTIRHRGYQVAQ